MPNRSEIFSRKGNRCARWKDSKGKTRTALVTVGKDGQDRLLIEASTYTAKYRDGKGLVREVPTGCRDETAARGVLADLQRRAELIKAKVMTSAEDAIADHQGAPLGKHFASYGDSLKAKGVTRIHREDTLRYLERLASECSFQKLADLDRSRLETWLAIQAMSKLGESGKLRLGMSARTRNAYQGAMVAFCNWCIENRRLAVNPFAGMPKANEKSDQRRQRRAMTEAELISLLDVARRRPIVDAMTVRRGEHKGKAYAKLSDQTKDRLEWVGRERALIYKTLVLTGLRKRELASLTVGQLYLDGQVAYAVLNAADEKNREGSEIAIRKDLAGDLKEWLFAKLGRLQSDCKRLGEPIPARLPTKTMIFNVPTGLVKIMNRDLKSAGIAKVDERGRTLDVHALRHTFGTHLSKGGVAPRTAQAAMRHSDIALTMNVYTDPKLLDVTGALDVLPALPLGSGHKLMPESVKATGTDDLRSRSLAPPLAPTSDFSSKSELLPDKMPRAGKRACDQSSYDVSPGNVKRNNPLSIADSGSSMSGRLDSNQRPPEPHSRGQGRFQPPNFTSASLLKTYRFYSSHILRRSE